MFMKKNTLNCVLNFEKLFLRLLLSSLQQGKVSQQLLQGQWVKPTDDAFHSFKWPIVCNLTQNFLNKYYPSQNVKSNILGILKIIQESCTIY